ncbi:MULTISPECIES: NAD(P)-binding domain-containing protein [unclassified Nocardioides]|uniref:NAD(P)-binding domain-containing protein n=1 Tax=unclassified Nocardioides TaxID=2615069 RepID=UPI0036232C6F
MPETTTVVVGAGHCGLAVSRHLAEHSVDHVVLERGGVANSWLTQRWDSLRLLTPNWMTRLPGASYSGADPDGFLTAGQVAGLVREYAVASAAPVHTGTSVTSVRPGSRGFDVWTDTDRWSARTVVLAVGTTRAAAPAAACHLPARVESVPATSYRNPSQLPDGGVLVVGASASGVQIAEELRLAGRQVTLAVGEHVRVPRRYRDHDVMWWLDGLGLLDERWDEVDDLARARHVPSLQLVGADRDLDLNALQALGVRLVGRVVGIRGSVVQFSGSLANVCTLADLKLGRLLGTIDDRAGGTGDRPAPTVVPRAPLQLDLDRSGIGSVVWATGVRPDFSFLDLPVFDHRGRLRHTGGVTPWPGLYVIGLPLLRRRRSTFIDGARADSADLVQHLVGLLDDRPLHDLRRTAP